MIFCLLQLPNFLVYKVVYAKYFRCRKWILFRDLSRRYNCSLAPSTYSDFKFILISSSWISSACVCCYGWDKLRLLVILLNILLIMLSWYPLSFNTCFILAFSFIKSSLLLKLEYAVLNKEVSLQFFLFRL